MIKSIHLQNFQSHKDTHLEFSPGVNVIIGRSDHGKTAIIRALRWVVENRPAGDEFRSHWAKNEDTAVQIILNNGGQVARWKNKVVNNYSCNGELFQGFGQDIPKPVVDALNLASINLQQQFDQPFLLFDSPGAVARYLNQVVHLEKIDIALANITSLKRQNDQDIRSQKSRIGELEQLEATFPDLEAAEEFITELEVQQKDRDQKKQKLDWLSTCQGELIKLRGNLTKVRIPIRVEEQVVDLSKKQTHKTQLEYTYGQLVGLQNKLGALRTQMQVLIPALRQELWVQELMTRNYLLDNKKKMLSRLKRFKQQIDQGKLELSGKLAIIGQDEAKFKKMMPDVCPLCGK